jgi:hypothetical protein
MKKDFQHKIILRVIIFSVLALIIANVSLPRIERYNFEVLEEQEKQRIEANGADDRAVSFSLSSLIDTAPYDLFAILLMAFFISLVLTRRIIQSSLFFIFFTVFVVFQTIGFRHYNLFFIVNGYNFVRSIYFELLFIAVVITCSHLLATLITRPFYKKSVLT